MSVRKGREPSASIEALGVFAEFDVPTRKTTMDDIKRRQAVINKISEGLDESLALDARLHGVRVQNMFQAVVISLGSFAVFKVEDAGNFYFDDAGGEVAIPDFRIVTRDGVHMLIEVKNVAPSQPFQTSLRRKTLLRQRRYAELTSARLLYAHYWSGFNLWTLVDSATFDLDQSGSNLTLTLADAMMANEMSRLGDATLATRAPIVMQIVTDQGSERRHTRDATDGEMLEVAFSIAEVRYYTEDRLIEDETERKLAHFLVMFGRWETEDTIETDSDDMPLSMTFTSRPDPEEDTQEKEGFTTIGALSSIYSTAYNVKTLNKDLEITSLTEDSQPEFLANLLPAEYWERSSRVLPVWKFVQLPPES